MKSNTMCSKPPCIDRLKPLALALAIGTINSQAAQPISIVNASFENPVQANGAFTGTATGWSEIGGISDAGVWNPAVADFSAEAPNGSNVGYVYGGPVDSGFSQVLAGNLSTLIADASYSLTVKVGNSITYTYDGYRVQLLAGNTVLAEDNNSLTPASDSFVTATVNYTYNAGLHSALLGQPLQIRLLGKDLSGGAGETEFDDVQLTVTLANPIANAGGPYTAFIGGSLFLNGNGSVPSDGATITAYDWELDGDDDFNDVTGATPAAISQADLVSVYGMELGSNPIKLRVTDSAAKTSTVETNVNIVPATAVVYEPFAYAGTSLAGAGGTSEVGLIGTWAANAATGLADNLPYGALVTRGGGVGNYGAGGNTYGAGRSVSASALAGNGLLNDGATLWFSAILGYDTGGNRTNTRLTMVLGDESMSTANFSYFFPTAGSTGLGVTMGRFSGVNGKLVATQVRDSTFGTGNAAFTTGNVYGNEGAAVYPGTNTSRDVRLVVGRITWGASSDTIDIFLPDNNLQVDLNAPHSSLTVNVNQSGYDTISFQRGDRVVWDEIRFGATYASVTETGSYWDLNSTTAGSGSATPSGTWNADPNWNASPDGTGGTSSWAAGSAAVFSAGNDATGSYNITVAGTQDIGGIIVEDGTVTVSGGTALRLTSNATVSVAGGLTATISTPFTENAAGRLLGKAGLGTAILSGDNSGVTGGMFLGGGATRFESPLSIPGSAQNVTIATAGTASFGSGFDATSIATALATRIVASSTGTIAVDNQLATNFDFNTPGLTAAYLGAIGNVTYTGTLTPNGTTYRLGGGGGILTMGNLNALTGANSLTVNGGSTVVLANANDYTGATTVPGGTTLRIMGATGTSGININQPSALLELGANGALGAGPLTVNGGFGNSPTISAVADSANTNAVTVGGSFNIGGSGNLSLGAMTLNTAPTITNNNTTGTTTIASMTGTNRNVTLSGNGSTTIGSITTGTGTLTKNGSGTLSLTGTNTNTGATNVNNAGTLLVTGSTGTGLVTLNNTSTLAGNGTIGGSLTVTATANVAPGTSVGTLAVTGDLTITAMAGGTGVINMELGPIATSDKITVGGTLIIGSTLGFTDFVFSNVGGLQNGTYKLITSGAAVNGTLDATPGALTGTIGAGPATGTLQISLSGTDIELVVSGVPGGGYSAWQAANSTAGTRDQDHDNDGVDNGTEHFLGGDTNTTGFTALPTVVDTAGTLSVTWTKAASYTGTYGTDFVVETSATLADPWTTETLGVNVTVTGNDVKYTFPNPLGAKRFARLRVTGP